MNLNLYKNLHLIIEDGSSITKSFLTNARKVWTYSQRILKAPHWSLASHLYLMRVKIYTYCSNEKPNWVFLYSLSTPLYLSVNAPLPPFCWHDPFVFEAFCIIYWIELKCRMGWRLRRKSLQLYTWTWGYILDCIGCLGINFILNKWNRSWCYKYFT